jgi:exodeoxyribonuclease V alpha subunit
MIPDIPYHFATYFDTTKTLSPYLYTLFQKKQEGHVCIHIKDKIDNVVLEKYHLTTTPHFAPNHLVGHPKDTNHPFILDGDLLYTQRMYLYEIQIAKRIQSFLQNTVQSVDIAQTKQLFEAYFPHKNTTSADWQMVAAIHTIHNNFTIITGGPGTGKTTTVAKILAILWQLFPHYKIALAAPTGKAAARMSESLYNSAMDLSSAVQQSFQKIPTSTIHRLLGSIKDSIYFKYHQDNPLPYDVIVIDECSMIDIALFAKLLAAIAPHTKLILLGDKNQLASVEAGSLFGDICNLQPFQNTFTSQFIHKVAQIDPQLSTLLTPSETTHLPTLTDHIITLEKSHRFNEQEGIGLLSKAIIENNEELLHTFCKNGGDHTVTIDPTYDDAIFKKFIQHFRTYIYDEQGNQQDMFTSLKHFNNARVLAATKQQEIGIYNLNIRIEQLLHQWGWINMYDKHYDYKPILVTRNNYTLGLHNGDIGILKKDTTGTVYAHFLVKDEQGFEYIKKILPGFLEYETCFAMTIHKSQGSEFNHILMILPPNEDSLILSRELIYTGLTRAKQSAIIQSSSSVFLSGCKQKVQRFSGLSKRL